MPGTVFYIKGRNAYELQAPFLYPASPVFFVIGPEGLKPAAKCLIAEASFYE